MLSLPSLFGVAFGLSECALSLTRRAKGDAVVQDRGSLALFWTVIPLAMFLSYFAAATLPMLKLSAAPVWTGLGTLLLVAGLALRWYAIHYLGRWFTVNVAVAADQPLIDSGPYRSLRHPSYTGALLALLGLALCIGNLLSIVLLVGLTLPVFLHRIQIEEQALARAFGQRWTQYCGHTSRLLPGLY